MKLLYIIIFCTIFFKSLIGQQSYDLDYFLPALNYDSEISNPQDFFGFFPGEWHLSHDQVLSYMQYLAASSNRIVLKEYGRTHEQRKLVHLYISHPDNIENLNEIRQAHLDLTYPDRTDNIGISNLPAVVNLGYTVHGNEPSGMHAALYVSYYLATAPEESVERLLRSCIIIMDPCMNPDGAQRFSTWVNMHRGKNLNADNASREFNEVWPGGRGNHYWFDLNRDWLPLVHPESRGRVRVFHEWIPNIVGDYHEMQTSKTYFFQPGIPGRTNPLTPDKNTELTAKIGKYHARYLDEIGSLYYSGEDFDDFYYGKGSTYPDIHGSVGILFEQASSRGHLQRSEHGDLSFPFTIRNQINTSLSTLQAAQDMRIDLHQYKRDFFKSSKEEALAHPVKAYVFDAGKDFTKIVQFLDILSLHQIDVFQLDNSLTIDGDTYESNSYIVPLDQRQHRLIRAIFDTNTTFQDSLFYDISSWTFPLAFNLSYAELKSDKYSKNILGAQVDLKDWFIKPQKVPLAKYAYLIDWDDASVPVALNELLSNEILIKCSGTEFVMETHAGTIDFGKGTLMIPMALQKKSPGEIQDALQVAVNKYGIKVYSTETGNVRRGSDMGSNQFHVLKKPEVMLLAGPGVSSLECGEIWHFLDQRIGIAPAIVETSQLGRVNLNSYNLLIMPSGTYSINESVVKKIKDWVNEGGVIIGLGQANRWLLNNKLAFLTDTVLVKDEKSGRMPYDSQRNNRGAGLISGAIFQADIDLSHPLFYGYEKAFLPVFQRGTTFYKAGSNPYSTPAVFSADFLLSGYIPKSYKDKAGGLSAVQVSGQGSGVIISFHNNPFFRGFWSGSSRMISNTIFLGHTINNATMQRSDE